MVEQGNVHTGITTAFSSWMISAVPVMKLNYRSVNIVPGCSTAVLAMNTFMPEFVVLKESSFGGNSKLTFTKVQEEL